MGGKSGQLVARCPHCGEPPGNTTAMVLFAGHGPWTCRECGEEFSSPAMVHVENLEDND